MRMDGEERREQIVKAMLELCAERDPESVSIQQVADRVGLSQPGVFRHFGNRDQLWLAVAEHLAARARRRWDRAAAREKSPLAALRAVLAAHLEFIRQTPAVPALLHSKELTNRGPELKKGFHRMASGLAGRVLRLVEEARQGGEIDQTLPANTVASLLMSQVAGLAIRWTLSGKAINLSEEGKNNLDLLFGFLSANANERPAPATAA